MTNQLPNIWVLATSHIGDNNNRMAIAKAISPNNCHFSNFIDHDLEDLLVTNGEPDIFIAGDEEGPIFSEILKELTRGKVFNVALQAPDIDSNDLDGPAWRDCLDMQILFSHLKTSGIQSKFEDPWPASKPRITYNVVPTCIDKNALDQAALSMPEIIKEKLCGPVYTICLGSIVSSDYLSLKSVINENINSMLQTVVEAAQLNNGSILLSTSRRTPDDCMPLIEEKLKGTNHFIYNPNDPEAIQNPYLSMLSVADHIVVSADSISMVSDAIATGKPTHIYVPGRHPEESTNRNLKQLFAAGKDLLKPEVCSYMQKLAETGVIRSTNALRNKHGYKYEAANSACEIGQDVFNAWKNFKLSL